MSDRPRGMDYMERGVKADELHTITKFTHEAAIHNDVIASIERSQKHLTPIEESSSPEALYRDAIRRYSMLGERTAGNAIPLSQQAMRNLRGRIDELLPTIAKNEITEQLKGMSKETYQRLLETRRKEIEAFDDIEGYDDTAEELVERDLINEKLRQLAKWETVKDTPTIVERKQRMRSLKARVTVLTNDINKKTREMEASWNPFTRWNLSQKLIALREKREAAQAMWRILQSAGEAPSRTTQVRLNTFDEFQGDDLEEIEEEEQDLAAK